MSRRLLRLAVALAGLGATSFAAIVPGLPPLSGELTGKGSLLSFPAIPKLDWKLTVVPAEHGPLTVKATATATGLSLVVRAEFASPDGDGSWRITSGEFEAAALFAAFAPQLGVAMAGASAEGRVVLSGEGTLRAGKPAPKRKRRMVQEVGLWSLRVRSPAFRRNQSGLTSLPPEGGTTNPESAAPRIGH